MMGTGKTTVGNEVAARLGWRFADVDELVEEGSGRSVPELFASVGEAGFRALEARWLAESLAESGPAVVAVGGGAVLDPGNRTRICGAGTVVWLRARPETLQLRVGAGAGRPLLSAGEGEPEEVLGRLAAARSRWYEEVADVVVDVDDLSVEQVAQRVCALAGAAWEGPR